MDNVIFDSHEYNRLREYIDMQSNYLFFRCIPIIQCFFILMFFLLCWFLLSPPRTPPPKKKTVCYILHTSDKLNVHNNYIIVNNIILFTYSENTHTHNQTYNPPRHTHNHIHPHTYPQPHTPTYTDVHRRTISSKNKIFNNKNSQNQVFINKI